MKRLALVLLVLLAATAARAQQPFMRQSLTAASAACPDAGCMIQDVQGFGSVGFQITGTFTQTIQIEGSLDGTTFVSVASLPNGGTATVTSATAPGVWTAQTAGFRFLRWRVSAFTSGTAVITSQAITAVARSLFPYIGPGVFAADGTVSLPSISFAAEPSTGLYRNAANDVRLTIGGVDEFRWFQNGWLIRSDAAIGFASNTALVTLDTSLTRTSAGVFGTGNTSLTTSGADVTTTSTGDFTRQRYQATLTPAPGVNCAAAFKAAALTADCTIATLPAGMKLTAIYADVTAGFTCSGTCTGTKVVQCGTAAGGTQVLAAGLNVAATGTFGLADADLGSGLTRAAAIQGGLIGSWSSTTPISCRFTSGTGNWGSGAATFVNAGSIKFTLVTEQLK